SSMAPVGRSRKTTSTAASPSPFTGKIPISFTRRWKRAPARARAAAQPLTAVLRAAAEAAVKLRLRRRRPAKRRARRARRARNLLPDAADAAAAAAQSPPTAAPWFLIPTGSAAEAAADAA